MTRHFLSVAPTARKQAGQISQETSILVFLTVATVIEIEDAVGAILVGDLHLKTPERAAHIVPCLGEGFLDFDQGHIIRPLCQRCRERSRLFLRRLLDGAG
ncbi:MAG: hypothetical protein MZV65_49285 [Chromatiales bacterium]|nr:hypothetical protein [Chromatiales bacterium]